MSKKNEPARPEARLPKGLFDTGAEEIRATERMLATIRAVFESYGFEPFDTPAIEYSDALGKFLPDQDRPNEGVFSFQDDDERWLSLRYDLTAPLARYVAETYQTLPKPFRRYQAGPVWRNEKPGPGRFRQFTQFDADTVGAASVAADAEMCMLTADTLEALGLKGQYVVRVNNRKVLDGVMEEAGVVDEKQRISVFRAIDKFDRLGAEGVVALLGKGRKDESGDFTKGSGLDSQQKKLILKFLDIVPIESSDSTQPKWDRIQSGLDSSDSEQQLKWLDLRMLKSSIGKEGASELRAIAKLIRSAGYSDRIVVDPSVVRGLEYYTGPVFEAELTAPITDERGKQIRLGSVVSGGRYDGLVERFTGQTVPATGVSIGVSRLLIGLKALGKLGTERASGPVVVLVLDRDRLADYQQMAQTLREANIRAEMYLGDSGMKAQMKYADKRGAPCVVIQGSDEKEKGEVQIKDLILGATLTAIKDRDEYLKKQAEAQFPVPQGKLVEAVRGVLSRHNV